MINSIFIVYSLQSSHLNSEILHSFPFIFCKSKRIKYIELIRSVLSPQTIFLWYLRNTFFLGSCKWLDVLCFACISWLSSCFFMMLNWFVHSYVTMFRNYRYIDGEWFVLFFSFFSLLQSYLINFFLLLLIEDISDAIMYQVVNFIQMNNDETNSIIHCIL